MNRARPGWVRCGLQPYKHGDETSAAQAHLHAAQELLATRARQGIVEVEVTQELLANERAFMERLQSVLEAAQRKKP